MKLRKLWQRIAPAVVTTVFYYGTLIYPLVRLLVWLFPEWQPTTTQLIVIFVVPLVPRMIQSLYPTPFTRWLGTVALTWLGICFQLFLLVLAAEILRLVVPLDDRTLGLIILAAITAIAIGGFLNAQWPAVKTVRVAAGCGAQGRKLVQISDVHIGSRRPRFLRRIVRKINALAPDAVMITGDLIDAPNVSLNDLRWLGEIDADTYFILGNHERYEDTEDILDRLRQLGIRVLRNESVDAAPFQFVGLDDADAYDTVKNGLVDIAALPDRFRVLLYHRPLGAKDAARWGADLMVCGHTHRGQLFPFNFLVRRLFPEIAGSYDVDGLHLYVSVGTGTWGPVLRVGSRSEVTEFQLTA